MVRSTFQLVPGLGPTREQRLWAEGVTDWTQLAGLPAGLLPEAMTPKLVAAAAAADQAFARGALDELAPALPAREHWRLFGSFAERAVYLDIETDAEEGITAVGLLDARGPRLLLAGRDLASFPEEVPPSALLVTFNGAAFDLPVLRRAFPDWLPPAAHVDLRPVCNRLGHWGGLKAIEELEGLRRPDHLRGLRGTAAAWLWRHGQRGDQRALRLFAEYNLYDVIGLRTLLGIAYNRLAAQLGAPAPAVPVGGRGDVLYDVSKILLAL